MHQIFMPQVHWMFFGTLNEPFIKFKESYDIVYFSSTDSTIEVESTFEHNLIIKQVYFGKQFFWLVVHAHYDYFLPTNISDR